MGSIEFVGIINNFFNTDVETNESTEIPENAHFVEDENWIDMLSPLNWFIVGVPIFVIILLIMAFKQRKNGIFNKEVKNDYNEKNKITGGTKRILVGALKRFFMVIIIFYIGFIIILPIHELLHCVAGALSGLDMKFGIDAQMFAGFAYSDEPMTKIQFLVMSLTPLIILGIIPLIIVFSTYPKKEKNYKKGLIYWILTCFIGCMIMSSCPDIIQSFNVIKNVPSNAIMENDYWYIPNDEIIKGKTNN